MQRQIEWNKYEAVVLLDAYLKTLTTRAQFSEIVADTSKKLRTMAVNNGMEIDDVFRNINGVTFQMYSMESAYLGYKKRIVATKLFKDIVRIYRENRSLYDKWLAKTNIMTDPQYNDVEGQFKAWLQKKTSFKVLPGINTIMTAVDEFCISRRIIKEPLMRIKDIKTIKKY